jgi:hypothetical protein
LIQVPTPAPMPEHRTAQDASIPPELSRASAWRAKNSATPAKINAPWMVWMLQRARSWLTLPSSAKVWPITVTPSVAPATTKNSEATMKKRRRRRWYASPRSEPAGSVTRIRSSGGRSMGPDILSGGEPSGRRRDARRDATSRAARSGAPGLGRSARTAHGIEDPTRSLHERYRPAPPVRRRGCRPPCAPVKMGGCRRRLRERPRRRPVKKAMVPSLVAALSLGFAAVPFQSPGPRV